MIPLKAVKAPTALDALRPEDAAALLALAHAGALATSQLRALCGEGCSLRTAQARLASLEGRGLLVQHHRSVRVGERTRRRQSIWELSPAGARLITQHPLAPPRPADLAGRTLERAELLGQLLVAIVAAVPDLAGLTVGLRPAIHPDRQRGGRADALIGVHRWREAGEAEPVGLMPWQPAIDRGLYRLHPLVVELDADGLRGEGLRQRARAYGEDYVWERSQLKVVPLPLWVVADGRRQDVVGRSFGAPWADRWLSVTRAGLERNRWVAWDAARRVASGPLAEVLGEP